MKRLLLLLAILAVPAVAYAVGLTDLDASLRVREVNYRYSDFTPGTDTDPGSNGLLAYRSVDTGGTNNLAGTDLVQPLYPTRLAYILVDNTANDTLTCTGISFRGLDQFGAQASETAAVAPSETVAFTRTVFARVDSYYATGCSDGTNAADSLAVYESRYMGLGHRIQATSDVEAACSSDISGTHVMNCGTKSQIQAAVSASGAWIDLLNTGLFDGQAGDDEDQIYLRIRSTVAK